MAGPFRGGGGVKGRTIKEKITFFGTFFFKRSKISTAIKLEGGRGVRLNGPTIKRRTFFLRLPLGIIHSYKRALLQKDPLYKLLNAQHREYSAILTAPFIIPYTVH